MFGRKFEKINLKSKRFNENKYSILSNICLVPNSKFVFYF